MKKLIPFLLVMFCSNVNALPNISKYSVQNAVKKESNSCLNENIIVNYDGRYIDEANIDLNITKDCDNDLIYVSSLFDKLASADGYMPGDGIKINLKITNESNFNYSYKNKSFILSTEDLQPYDLEIIPNTKGFNNFPIYKPFALSRTVNSAIKSLYGKTNITNQNIKDEYLEILLNEAGYDGIKELNKYYINFYNEKYNLHEMNLEDFAPNIISEIFNGKYMGYTETNPEVSELGFNFWYNNLFSFHFDSNYDYKNSSEYSIGSYMRDSNLGNEKFSSSFDSLKINESHELNNMNIHLNPVYITNAYMNYNFSAYLELTLEKEKIIDNKKEEYSKNDEDETFKVTDESIIVPPKTGLD